MYRLYRYNLYIFAWLKYFWGPPVNCLISKPSHNDPSYKEVPLYFLYIIYSGLPLRLTIEVALRVDSISPNHGSIYGGTIIMITGIGFGMNSDEVEVTVAGFPCHLLDIADTNIVCQIGETANTIVITNINGTGCK